MSDELSDFHQNLSSLSKNELVSLIALLAESDNHVWEKIKIILKNKFPQFEKSVSPSPESKNFSVTRQSSAQEKINLYKSLFRGRTDVYALRWENAKSVKSGYSPVCLKNGIPATFEISRSMKCQKEAMEI